MKPCILCLKFNNHNLILVIPHLYSVTKQYQCTKILQRKYKISTGQLAEFDYERPQLYKTTFIEALF